MLIFMTQTYGEYMHTHTHIILLAIRKCTDMKVCFQISAYYLQNKHRFHKKLPKLKVRI